MGAKERILTIRLIEKARANPGYAKVLGITVAERGTRDKERKIPCLNY